MIHCVECPLSDQYRCLAAGKRKSEMRLCPHTEMRHAIEKTEAAPKGAALPYGEERG